MKKNNCIKKEPDLISNNKSLVGSKFNYRCKSEINMNSIVNLNLNTRKRSKVKKCFYVLPKLM